MRGVAVAAVCLSIVCVALVGAVRERTPPRARTSKFGSGNPVAPSPAAGAAQGKYQWYPVPPPPVAPPVVPSPPVIPPLIPIPWIPPPIPPPPGSPTCPGGVIRVTCPSECSFCPAYPGADCTPDPCNNCAEIHRVEGSAVCCGLCRSGLSVVGGQDQCPPNFCAGTPNTYCETNHCDVVVVSCVPKCPDSTNALTLERPPCLQRDRCYGIPCTAGTQCVFDPCTCNPGTCVPVVPDPDPEPPGTYGSPPPVPVPVPNPNPKPYYGGAPVPANPPVQSPTPPQSPPPYYGGAPVPANPINYRRR